MPPKKKRVSAFAVKCKETNKEKDQDQTKDKQKKGKPKKEEIVEIVDELSSVQLQDEEVSQQSSVRRSKRGKKSPKVMDDSPRAKDKSKSKETKVNYDTDNNADSRVSIIELDNEKGTESITTDWFDMEKKTRTKRLSNDEKEKQIDDGKSPGESANKRKSVEIEKKSVPYKKSKTDLSEKHQSSSEKNIQEQEKCNSDTSGWTEMGKRLQSRAGYDDLDINEDANTEEDLAKSLTAIPVDGSVLVIASHPCEFPLKGIVTVQSLFGIASIMGYRLEPGGQGQHVYSPECNSLVTICTVEGVTNANSAVDRVDALLGIREKTVLTSLKNVLTEKKPFVVLKFDKLKTTLSSFIANFHPYSNIFKVEGDRTQLNKQLLPLSVKMPGKDVAVPRLSVPEQLQSVLDVWKENLSQPKEDQPVVLVCGGKDSGKSTSNRLLINTSLNTCESVYYLECDIGQTEFTPPGVLSLVKVTSPVLGPPFTHQRKTVCSYHYGSVTPTNNPDLYIRCVQLCVKEYQQAQVNGPLIVNTMGWMKGLGWQLLLDTVRLVSPSIIVQLTSNQNSQNVTPLSVGDLRESSWTDLSKMFTGETIERRMKRIPKMIHLEAPVSTRNLSILSHLGADLEPGLTLTSMTSFTVGWNNVAIHMRHEQVPRSQVMYALNANMVALCEGDISKAELHDNDGPLFLKKSKQPFRWHGYGLVRGIDMVKKKFYVLTSLTEEELARVNMLDIGGISVPENFLITQKGDKVLYVDEVVESKGLSAVRPRKHMPRKGLRGNNQ